MPLNQPIQHMGLWTRPKIVRSMSTSKPPCQRWPDLTCSGPILPNPELSQESSVEKIKINKESIAAWNGCANHVWCLPRLVNEWATYKSVMVQKKWYRSDGPIHPNIPNYGIYRWHNENCASIPQPASMTRTFELIDEVRPFKKSFMSDVVSMVHRFLYYFWH